MARDSTRTPSVAPKPRRSSAPAPDPSRSSMRRVNPRRNVVTRPSATPPPRSEPPTTPRNRRVARARKEPSGPGFATRLGHFLFSGVGSLTRGVTGSSSALGRLWRDRLVGPAASSLRVLGVCAFLAGAIALGRFVQHHLTTAPAFAVDRIEVKGLARLQKAEVLEAAGVELGSNVFARSPEEIRARLLRHPWIISAEVQRQLPSRFELSVREREPVALLVVEACKPEGSRGEEEAGCDEPSSLYLVSGEAKMFKRLSGKDPVDLPVITGVTRQRLASDPDFPRRVLVDGVALLHEYRNSGLWQRSAIGEIHIESNDGFSLYVGEDLTYVRLGAKPFTQKLLRMKRVFERLSRESAHAEYIYLDNEQRPDRVTVRLR